MKTSEDKKT